MKTFVIADLRLYNDDQLNKMELQDFSAMNNYIIKQWNQVVKNNDDLVIVMGEIGNGDFNDLKNFFSKLNGKLVMTSYQRNNFYTKDQWKEIGFDLVWNCGIVDNESKIICEVNKIKKEIEDDDYIIAVDSNNEIEDLVEKNWLSVSAISWNYNPIETKEIRNIYNNMISFYQLDVNEEHRSSIED